MTVVANNRLLPAVGRRYRGNSRTFLVDAANSSHLSRQMAFFGVAAAKPSPELSARREVISGPLFRNSTHSAWAIILARCAVSQSHVESFVHCGANGSCSV
jgi:hypothetical protein